MNIKEIGRKCKSVITKIGQRNMIIIGAVLLIGIAVMLNIILFSGSTEQDAGNLNLEGADLENAAANGNPQTNYFSETVLSRQKARDEAIEVLQAVVSSKDAIDDAKEKALEDISTIAREIEKEANIETLVKSKGFAACVAVVSGEKATVIVESSGLLASEIAQINEIVYEQAGILPANLNIVEKSAA